MYTVEDVKWIPLQAKQLINKWCYTGRTVTNVIANANSGNSLYKIKSCDDLFNTYEGLRFQFAIEKKEPTYKPFDFSDSSIREMLRGRWIRKKDGSYEKMISYFRMNSKGEWLAANMSAQTMLDEWEFVDADKVCGTKE